MRLLPATLITAAFAVTATQPPNRQIGVTEYRDKVYGAWAGTDPQYAYRGRIELGILARHQITQTGNHPQGGSQT